MHETDINKRLGEIDHKLFHILRNQENSKWFSHEDELLLKTSNDKLERVVRKFEKLNRKT